MSKSSDQQVAYFLYKLDRYRNYVEFSENSWDRYLAEYSTSLKDDALNVARFGGKRDHSADLAQTFPQYHRRASFLMLFAMFEDDLNQLCEIIAAERQLMPSVKKIRGRGVQRAKAWLKDVAGLALTTNAADWAKIKQFRDVRNVLMHAAGFLDSGNPQHERVRKFAEVQGSGLELRHYVRTEVTLRSEFLPTVIDTLEAIYTSLGVAPQ